MQKPPRRTKRRKNSCDYCRAPYVSHLQTPFTGPNPVRVCNYHRTRLMLDAGYPPEFIALTAP